MQPRKRGTNLSQSFASMGVSTLEGSCSNLFVTPTKCRKSQTGQLVLGTESATQIQYSGDSNHKSHCNTTPLTSFSFAQQLDVPPRKQRPVLCSGNGGMLLSDDGEQSISKKRMSMPAHLEGPRIRVPLLPDDDSDLAGSSLSSLPQGSRIRVLPRARRNRLFFSSYTTSGSSEEQVDSLPLPLPPRLTSAQKRRQSPSATSPSSKRMKISWPSWEDPCPERPPSLKMRVHLRRRCPDFVSSIL